jgi:hypothetical protein
MVSMGKSTFVLGHPAHHAERAAQAFRHTVSLGCCWPGERVPNPFVVSPAPIASMML